MPLLDTTHLLLIAAAALAGIGVVLFAVLYIRAADRLHAYLLAQYPTVGWDKSSAGLVSPSRWNAKGGRLAFMVLGRQPLEKQDAAYHRLAAKARIWMALWLLSLFGFLIALGFLTQPR